MITIPNIDGKIWNIEYYIIDIIKCITDGNLLTISLNSEGPDAAKLGLYDLLDNICDQFNYPKRNITIITCNQLEAHPEYNIQIRAPLYIQSAQEFSTANKFPEKTFGNNFKHFGFFIGRSNWLRLWIGSYLYNKFRNQTAMTFHYNPTLDFHRDHLGLDELFRFDPASFLNLNPIDFINQCPIKNYDIEKYPILTPEHFNISKIYHTFFLEIVCETYSRGNSFYPTEKLWRPIINRTPFIIQGPKNYIKNLHRIGFKTFSNWFDESHSQDEYDYQPIAICRTLNRISSLSITDLEGMYIDMKDTLEHNYQILMLLNNKKITEIFK
jgi:hypothetical protein